MDSLEHFCVIGNLILNRLVFTCRDREVNCPFPVCLAFQYALTESAIFLIIASRLLVFWQDIFNGRTQSLICLEVGSGKLIYEVIKKPNFDARVTLDENNSLLFVFLLCFLINGVLRFVLDQGIGVDDEKYRIGTFLWVLAKFLVYEFQVLLI